MTNYMKNYGFAKTYINTNNNKITNEIKWIGDYDGNNANIELNINDNGNKKLVNIQLDNNDIMKILGIQPIQIPLDRRLKNDFSNNVVKPIVLEGVLTNKKTRKYSKRKQLSRRHTYKHNLKKKS